MELSLVQKDILITLITLYHQHSRSIKGEDIADMIQRNPGTVRNQMQALKTIGLVDGVPGPKGVYPHCARLQRTQPDVSEGDYDVSISRNGEIISGATVREIDFTTLCHPDICHAVIKLLGAQSSLKSVTRSRSVPLLSTNSFSGERYSGKMSRNNCCSLPQPK